MTRRDLILAHAGDAAKDFIIYSRKDDDELPPGAIEEAIMAREVTIQEILSEFARTLREWGGVKEPEADELFARRSRAPREEQAR